MSTDINKWEEILYGYFGTGLQLHKLIDLDEYDNVWDAKIVPTEDNRLYKKEIADTTGVPGDQIGREFEKETSRRKALMPSELDRFQYATGLKYKFQVYIERLPELHEICSKLYVNALEKGEKWNTRAPYFTIKEYCKLLEFVDNVISKSIETSKKVIQDAENFGKEHVQGAKLKWRCNATVAAFVIDQLFTKGYLEEPMSGDMVDKKKLLNLVESVFEFTAGSAHIEKLFSENSSRSLGESERAKFKIPHAGTLKNASK